MATTYDFAFTGSVQTHIVPAGVYAYLVKMWGASGGGAVSPFGLGGYVEGELAVTPGQSIYVYVGGPATGSGTGGFNGGGSRINTGAGKGGGGATDIRVGGTALTDRKAVAGGGGACGNPAEGKGGVGGGLVGGNGSGTAPGLGGTALAGGASGGGSATAGALGVGGNGDESGSGGGGYYGGGGGAPGADDSGGGGGSSYYGGLTSAATTSGLWLGAGKASLTVISQLPNAPIPTSPINNDYIGASVTNRFSYTYSADTAQAQTAQDIRYRVVGSPTWTTVSATTANAYRDFTSGTFTTGSAYEWQARATNSAGIGPWSASAFFRVATQPTAPVITAPALNADVSTPTNLTWTVTNQTYYEVRRVADAAGSPDTSIVYEDTGAVVDSATRTRSLMFTVNNRYEHLQVRVFYNTLWSAWTSRRVHALANRPLSPNVYLVGSDDTASLDVIWSTPTPGGGDVVVAYNEIWIIDDDEWVRVATNLGPTGTFTYWTPRSGVDYDLRVRVVAVGVDGSTSEGIPSGAVGTPYGAGPYGAGPYGG